jgi:hypothetical protein
MTLQTRLELSDRALKAMKRAVANVLKEHRLTGDPIYVLRNGKVVQVPASKIGRKGYSKRGRYL